MGTCDYQEFFGELAGYEKKGIRLVIKGSPASPMQIVNACTIDEDIQYMRDYVLDEDGDIESLGFDQISPAENTSV